LKVSIIIPIFNKIAIVRECIQLNIIHCTLKHEWIIIDNNSDNETKLGLRELQSEAEKAGHTFTIITEIENTGVARAWNKGLSLSTKEYICILNNDCVMMPDWDVEMIKNSETYKLGISTPFVVESRMCKSDYNITNFLDGKKDWHFLIKKNIGRVRHGAFTGVILFGKKSHFTTVGMFDERFWVSLEEYDYLFRAKVKGIATGTIGSVSAFHMVGITRSSIISDGGVANQQYFRQKWGWNFEVVEQAFPNKQIKSVQKWLFKNFWIMSTISLNFPKSAPLHS